MPGRLTPCAQPAKTRSMLSRRPCFIVASVAVLAACASAPAPAPAPSVPESPSPAVSAGPRSDALKPAGEATLGDRTKCLTSGEEFVVTADSPKVEYQGKTYYFCCSGCDHKFARDPQKYLKKPDA